MVRRYISWAGMTLAAAALLALTACEKKAAGPPPAPEVEVVSVAQRDVPVYGEWVATLDGYVNAQIQPQVTGYLIRRDYTEGTLVKKGQVLFEIDPRPFQAALEQAKGQLAQMQAQLAKTTMDVERDTPLAAKSAIPQAQLDNDVQAKAAAQAMVDAAQAQVDQAQLNLGFTKVRSLVDGLAGFAKGQIGDLVGPTTVLTTVSQVNPIKAYFAISDQEYLSVAGTISQIAAGKPIPKEESGRVLQLVLADGSVYPNKGWYEMADRQVDQRTGTMRIAGAFDNPDNILRPGQFARVRIPTGTAKGALLVPQRAVVEVQGTYQVTVVGNDNKADVRAVKVGERVGSLWIIAAGLKPGEQVIVEGVQKARTGTLVKPKPWSGSAAGE
ncbi:MAG TPA: efflux RND transporter periplasmic adaptor subunit [Terriglobales bacterium]|nr:efflux RND transporter periplasmic adaptor subunit [Terriglobales bacterium]